MHTIFLADVFGETQALQNFAAALTGDNTLISPYDEMLDFVDEAQAYAYFMQHVGLDKYCQKIIDCLVHCKEPVTIIAFSMGASAIWKISAMDQLASNIEGKDVCANINVDTQVNAIAPISAELILWVGIKGALCFYSSQIRHLTHLHPRFPIQIVFPKHEPHFSVAKVMKQLSGKQQVSIHKAEYLHGFMNTQSSHFNKEGYQQYFDVMSALKKNTSYHLANFEAV